MKKTTLVIISIVLFTLTLIVTIIFSASKVNASTITQQLSNQKEFTNGNSKYIVRQMSSDFEQKRAQFYSMQKKAVERNKRFQTIKPKTIYEPDKCDSGYRPRQWIQTHCNDKDFS